MKKPMGAQAASDGRADSRFATLTSGLLARKGQAAPSNSPVADPAEEADAYTFESPRTVRAVRRDRHADPAPPQARAPLTVINERSAEAGYPENPCPEDITLFGGDEKADDAVSALPGIDSYRDNDLGDLDFLEELISADERRTQPDASAADGGSGPWARQSVPAVAVEAAPERRRAAVDFRMTTRDFLRLQLGAAELDMAVEDIIVDAIGEFLDARGVESLAGCECLKSAAAICEKACRAKALDDD